MTSMIRWDPTRLDPFKELEQLSERFSRIFGRVPARNESGREALTVADWVPMVDIAEDDKEYLIKAEIPEVDKKDVKVTLQEGVLTIQGERNKRKRRRTSATTVSSARTVRSSGRSPFRRTSPRTR